MHDVAAEADLLGDVRVEREQHDAVLGLDDMQGVTLADLQAGEDFLGQDDADGIADGAEFEGGHGVELRGHGSYNVGQY